MWTYVLYGEGCKNLYVCMSLAMRACVRAAGRPGGRVRSIHSTYMASSSLVGTYDMYIHTYTCVGMYCNSRIVTTVRMSMWSHVCIYLAVLCDYICRLSICARPAHGLAVLISCPKYFGYEAWKGSENRRWSRAIFTSLACLRLGSAGGHRCLGDWTVFVYVCCECCRASRYSIVEIRDGVLGGWWSARDTLERVDMLGLHMYSRAISKDMNIM